MTVPADRNGADPAAPDYHGHRARLRQRLVDHGGEGLHDHELIEYLLALAIPRRDTKPLAKALLAEFGGIGGLMAASPESLLRIKGMGDTSVAAIRIVQATAQRLLRADVAAKPVIANWQALLDYLRADMAFHPVERVRVLHLNTRNMLIRDEVVAQGTIDEAAVHVREILKRAIELGSAAIILVHNHPGGDPSPSRADIELTRSIAAALKVPGIALHDHIIVGAQGHVSLRAQGLL
ncbi:MULTISPECIES: RadC family protein [Sphingomonas]|uniref:RadC family protein n=1 Tax=Sphingomonas TaxID=13687 RepID=UPI00082F87BC|nr:DNA repair protein RadC [Sphingomonas sp. CCH10-B3]